MDELQKFDIGCQLVMGIWSAWEHTVTEDRAFLTRDIHQRMIIFAAHKNFQNEPLTISILENYLCDVLRCSEKTAKDYVKANIDRKILLIEADKKDKRKRNIVVSDEYMERLIKFFSQLDALNQLYAVQLNPPSFDEQPAVLGLGEPFEHATKVHGDAE
jgi:hypothetical protein